jgi:hypothetical protein
MMRQIAACIATPVDAEGGRAQNLGRVRHCSVMLCALLLAGCTAANGLFVLGRDLGGAADGSAADLAVAGDLAGRDLSAGGPDLAKGGGDLSAGGPDLAKSGLDLSTGGRDLAGSPPPDLAGGCAVSCAPPFVCCGDLCINLQNDPTHCGTCTTKCTNAKPFCQSGTCATPPCTGLGCPGSSTCCGQFCCTSGQLCCDVPGPGPTLGPTCYTPTSSQPTCPRGCPLCL